MSLTNPERLAKVISKETEPANWVEEAFANIEGGGGGDGFSVTAVFTQGENRIFTTDSLDALREYLAVTVNYADGTSETIDYYELTGTLTAGVSTITVTVLNVETTFTVNVTAATKIQLNLGSPTDTTTYTGFVYNTADKSLLVETNQAGAYKGVSYAVTLKDGYRYRFKLHVTYFSGTVRVGLRNSSSTFITDCYTYPDIKESKEIVWDCCPSDSDRFTESAIFGFLITLSTSENGKAEFRNFELIEYNPATAEDIVDALLGGVAE